MQIHQLWQALLPLVLAGSAAATVSCSTKEINLIQNPSFEAGLDNWTVYRGTIGALRGPDSADDDYYLENTGANPNEIGQTVSGLEVGRHYTVSAEWRFKPSTWRGHCAVIIITASGPVALEEVEVSEAGSDWMTVSGTFSASASSQDVYIVQECDRGGEAVVMDLDDVQILTSTIACSTVTPSATPSRAPSSTPLVVSTPLSLTPIPRPSASSHAPSVSPSSRLVTVTSRPHRPRPSSTVSRRPIKPSSSVPDGSSGVPTITSTIGPQPSGTPGNGGSGNDSGSGNGNDSGSGNGNGSGSGNGNGNGSGTGSGSELTTSTVFTTRTSTITACPETVTDCPARSTYVTTETVLVSTTVCPVEATTTGAGGPVITGSPSLPSNGGQGPQYTTETILTTRTVTVTACPSSVTDCPARQKTTSVTTETLVASTSVYEVTPTAAPAPAQTGAGSRSSSGSGSGSGSEGSNGNTAAPQVTAPATLSSAQIPVVTVPVTKIVTVYACPAENKSPF